MLGSYMRADLRPLSNTSPALAQLPLQGGSDVRDVPGLDEKEELCNSSNMVLVF